MLVTLAMRLAVIAADVIVVTITWIRTFHHVKEASRIGVSVRISAILLRDGESICVVYLLFLHATDVKMCNIGSLYFLYVLNYAI